MMTIDFNKGGGLVPVVVQDNETLRVLMLGYMNAEALEKTLAEGRVTFYSRTKQRLWTKGETSGNYLAVVDIKADCDNDALLLLAKPAGPVCHTGSESCFNTAGSKGFIYRLQGVIRQRIDERQQQSYTYGLYSKGINKMAQKVGEEAVELVIEAKDNDDALFKNEAADLLYHLLILLKAKGMQLEDIEDVLRQRA